MRLVDYLAQNAIRYPDKIAVVCGDQYLTYAQLWQEVERRSHDFRPHEVVCFRSSQDIDFLVTYMAVHLAGGVSAPLEHGMPDVLFEEVCGRLREAADGIADILYTTGTTGQSKGVMVSHRALIADAENLIAGPMIWSSWSMDLSTTSAVSLRSGLASFWVPPSSSLKT